MVWGGAEFYRSNTAWLSLVWVKEITVVACCVMFLEGAFGVSTAFWASGVDCHWGCIFGFPCFFDDVVGVAGSVSRRQYTFQSYLDLNFG